jgi:hypothetical protein
MDEVEVRGASPCVHAIDADCRRNGFGPDAVRLFTCATSNASRTAPRFKTWSNRAWRIFWKRANGRWFRYQPCPDAPTLAEALRVIDVDPHGCFFG